MFITFYCLLSVLVHFGPPAPHCPSPLYLATACACPPGLMPSCLGVESAVSPTSSPPHRGGLCLVKTPALPWWWVPHSRGRLLKDTGTLAVPAQRPASYVRTGLPGSRWQPLGEPQLTPELRRQSS